MSSLSALPASLALLLLTAAPAAAFTAELDVPLVHQSGDVANCGPTAVAMLLAAYDGTTGDEDLARLRDRVGAWSWEAFPMRSWRLPGRDPGMTTPAMVRATLARFARGVSFEPLRHAFIPLEVWSILGLQAALARGRPVLALVETPILWGTESPGLHWVVVRGIEDGQVVYNDPADARRWTIPLERFWRAWRLAPVYRTLPGIEGFTAFVADQGLPLATLRE